MDASPFPSLQRVLNSEHTTVEAVDAMRTRFQAHPARVAVVDDFLKDPVARSVASFLANEVEFTQVYGLYGRDPAEVDESEWASADDARRFYSYGLMTEGATPGALTPALKDFLTLRSTLLSHDFVRFLSEVAERPGKSIRRVESHRMAPGDMLRRHNDRRKNRMIACVLYLSPGWTEAYGGRLRMHSDGDQAFPFDPTFNRLLLFDVNGHQAHEIEPILGGQRITLGWWVV